MKNVTLYFPNNRTLTEFILSEQIPGIVTHTEASSADGELTDQQIAVACTKYLAHYKLFLLRVGEGSVAG